MAKDDAKSALSAQEAGRRVAAARVLRGHEQRPAFAKEVAKKHDLAWSRLGHIERGTANLDKHWREALVEELSLPERWFTAPLEELLREKSGEVGTPEPAPSRLEEKIDDLSEKVESVVAEAMNRVLERLPPGDPPSDQGKDAREK